MVKMTNFDHLTTAILKFWPWSWSKFANFDHLTTVILKFWPWSRSKIFDHLTMTPGRRPNGQKIMVILPPPKITLTHTKSHTVTQNHINSHKITHSLTKSHIVTRNLTTQNHELALSQTINRNHRHSHITTQNHTLPHIAHLIKPNHTLSLKLSLTLSLTVTENLIESHKILITHNGHSTQVLGRPTPQKCSVLD